MEYSADAMSGVYTSAHGCAGRRAGERQHRRNGSDYVDYRCRQWKRKLAQWRELGSRGQLQSHEGNLGRLRCL